jgi:hypothetical protein
MKNGIPNQFLSLTTAEALTLQQSLTSSDFGRAIWNLTTTELWIWAGTKWFISSTAVDEFLEFPLDTAFPFIGEANKYYLDKFTGRIWRWSGTQYVDLTQEYLLALENGLTYNPITKTGELGGILSHETVIDCNTNILAIYNVNEFSVTDFVYLTISSSSGGRFSMNDQNDMCFSANRLYLEFIESGQLPDRLLAVNSDNQTSYINLSDISRTKTITTNIMGGDTDIVHNFDLPSGSYDNLNIQVRQDVSGVQEWVSVKVKDFTANQFTITSKIIFTNCKVIVMTATSPQ